MRRTRGLSPVRLIVLLCAALGTGSCVATSAQNSPVTPDQVRLGSSVLVIHFRGLQESPHGGTVCVALWESTESFMKDEKWFRSAAIQIKDAINPCVFRDLPIGTYSVSAFYDVTDCGRFRRDGLGIPIDPWAISNGGPVWMPPSWGASKFEMGEGTIEIELDFTHRGGRTP